MSTLIRAHDPIPRGALGLILAGLGLFAACIGSKDETIFAQPAAGSAGEGGAGGGDSGAGGARAELGGAGGSPGGAGGATMWTAGRGGMGGVSNSGTLIGYVCVGGTIEESCADRSCRSLNEERQRRSGSTSYFEGLCQGADGSPRVVISGSDMWFSWIYVFDAASGALVADWSFAPESMGAYCNFRSAILVYGDTGGDCRQRAFRDGCPNPDGGPPVCVWTDAGAGG